MRVGLVCPYSLDVHGGVQNHVLDLAEELSSTGHDVAVLAPGERSGELPPYVTTVGRAVPMPYNGSVARVSFGPLVAGRVRRWLAGGRFDVVHIHEPATPSVSVLALWATRAPVVATFHTAQSRSWALETSAATLLRTGLAKIDQHVVVSEEAGRTMGRYLAARPTLIPNGVRLGRFAATAGADPGRRIAFVGRIDEPRKGLQVLLDAFPDVVARHPEARLTVVGAGSAGSLLRGIPRPVLDRIDFVGPLDDEAKARVLTGAEVLVAPNTHGESFGMVLVEAMAARAAVVASDLPAFRSVLADGAHGRLFRTGDAVDLVAQLDRLLDDNAGRERLVERARAAAAGYDWSVLAPRVVEVYRRAQAGFVDAAAG